jgi:predicted PurR-regulated permease PerM
MEYIIIITLVLFSIVMVILCVTLITAINDEIEYCDRRIQKLNDKYHDKQRDIR